METSDRFKIILAVFIACLTFSCGKSSSAPPAANSPATESATPDLQTANSPTSDGSIESTETEPIDETTEDNTSTVQTRAKLIPGRLSLGNEYRLNMKMDGVWHEFHQRLPKLDLSDLEFDLLSSSSAEAKLTCLSPDCSRSRLTFWQGQTTVEIKQIKMNTASGELQRNCETPVFFDYEYKQITEDTSVIKETLNQLRSADSVYSTFSHITSTDGKDYRSLHVEIYSQGIPLIAMNDAEQTDNLNMRTTRRSQVFSDSISYGLIGEGPDATLDFIKLHFKLDGQSNDRLCYHMPMVAETLD